MQKIQSYEALSACITRQMRPGVCTNAFFRPDEYVRAIEAGQLWGEALDGGYALLWARDGYDRLSFWLSDPSAPIGIAPRRATVLEIACRARDTALQAVGRRFEEAGFVPLFDRVRLRHPAFVPPPCAIDAASPAEAPQAEEILRASFHPLAGCLPTREELIRALAEGRCLCRRDDAHAITAILHYTSANGAAKLQHLAVLPRARRRGEAAALIRAFHHATGGCRSVVWTQADNVAALACYQKSGYAPDGWRAGVWLWNNGG